MPQVWRLLTVPNAEDAALAKKLGQRDWLAALMRLRGIDDLAKAEAFLNPDLKDLPDPFLLTDMDKAVERLIQALNSGETVAIYGDYDADGVSATAVMVRGLQELGFTPPLTYIPDRFDEGYGLNIEALDYLLGNGADLVVTVDCGISAIKEADFMRQQGVDLIITDHHQPGSELPQARAVVNPQRIPSAYPTPYLAGVGVAYELIRALSIRLQRYDALQELTALVAIGTVADLMDLNGVNRILVRDGLKTLGHCYHPGLQALLEQAGLSGEPNATQIAFNIVPKINASGRMQHADLALELLLCEDPEEAKILAKELERLNELRKRTEQEVYQEALTQYQNQSEADQALSVQIMYAPHWHPGVLGIVAARLVEKLQRPVLVACAEEGGVKGSGRVPEGYNLYQLLSGAEDLLTRFGGHVQAAGFSCALEDLSPLQERLCRQLITYKQGLKEICADLEMPVGGDWQGIYRSQRRLEPFGNGNEEPVWLLRGAEVKQIRLMGQGEHLSAVISCGGTTIDLVAWRKAAGMTAFNGMVDLMVRLVRNVFRGQDTIRLELVDWRPTMVEHLETIQKIRKLPLNATLHYSMSESYVALLESGRAEKTVEALAAPCYPEAEYPALPRTQSTVFGSGSGSGFLLDPLFEPLSGASAQLVSVLQRRSWQHLLNWLLPDVAGLRQYYRWLRGIGDCVLSEIPWEGIPGGLQGTHAEHALSNVLEIFTEAGFCEINDEDQRRMLCFNSQPQQVRIEDLPSFQRLQKCREELQR